MGWIDTIVVGIIILVGLLIFYKALQEPINAIGRGIRNLFGYVREGMGNIREGGYETIQYG